MMPAMTAAQQDLPVPAILDIEASGFGRNSYPIEVGFVLPDGHSFCTLIRPEPDWTHWDSAAENLHHIARKTLLQQGRPVAEVAHALNQQLRGMTVYSDGWLNDYSWLACLYEVSGLKPAFRLDNLRILLEDAQAEEWHTIKQEVSLEHNVQRHRASTDARLLQLTLQRLRQARR